MPLLLEFERVVEIVDGTAARRGLQSEAAAGMSHPARTACFLEAEVASGRETEGARPLGAAATRDPAVSTDSGPISAQGAETVNCLGVGADSDPEVEAEGHHRMAAVPGIMRDCLSAVRFIV